MTDRLDSAITELAEQLVSHVVPLFSVPAGKRPVLIGTGLLVRGKFRLFLVSAKHVIDHAKPPRRLYFYSDERELRRLTGQVRYPFTSANKVDRLDVAVVALPKETPLAFRGVWKVPISMEQLTPRQVPRKSHHYLVVGFPKSRSRADPSTMRLRIEPHSFRVVSSPESSYRALGLHEDSHIVMNLNIGKMHFPDGSIRPIPDPHGMSGSPLWLLFDEEGPNDSAKTPMLGILIEHHKQANLLVATDIGIVLDLIQEIDQ